MTVRDLSSGNLWHGTETRDRGLIDWYESGGEGLFLGSNLEMSAYWLEVSG